MIVYYSTPCKRTFNNDLTKNKNVFIDTFLTRSPKAQNESCRLNTQQTREKERREATWTDSPKMLHR